MFVTPAFAQSEGSDAVHLPPQSDAAAAHGETVHIEGEHEGGFPPFNSEFYPSQLLWLAITFGVFYWVLKRVVLPRIGSVLENRRDRIALDLEAAERMKSDADEAHAAYEQELAEARDRAHKIAQEARDSARSDAEKERKRLDADLDEKLDAAQARIAEVKRSALGEVDQIARDVTDAILREVAQIEASAEEIAGAVDASRG
ncbi:F0F1 ATP synthase subunit B [Aurantimonas sp. VKM B-3413]|uniref:F0F1 ATP synthase subunit B n=1 Tax=Aurantimonas sp. VKM B-3413 TaxID=2779401 RepID=UPI001E36D388|nr:F0F1 ATP synthase subunit B [Aurantimonas sp. VKM B-3413]MCB8838755.1 F0F1 ATP synthase subunit B [Aurantimonas sp. VKM B-3413]